MELDINIAALHIDKQRANANNQFNMSYISNDYMIVCYADRVLLER